MAFNPTIPGYSTQGKSFSRTAAFPLESYEIWDGAIAGQSFNDLVAYAANTDASKDPSYIGQKVAYIDRTNNRVVHYGIEIDGTLKELGADKMNVDALTKADEGKIPKAFYVVDSAAEGEEGSEDYKPEVGHVEVRWVTPEAFEDTNTVTTVEAADKSVDVSTTKNDTIDKNYKVKVNISAKDGNSLSLEEDGLYVEVPEVVHPEYAIRKEEKEGYHGVYHLTKDGADVDVAIEVPVTELIDYSVTCEVKDSAEGDEHSAFKHYSFMQCGKEVAHVDVPKDLVVESGTVETKAEAGVWGEAGTYIVLVIANQETPIYVNVKDLVDIYGVDDTATIDMSIDASNKITANVKISAVEGNSLVAKEDGLYVNAPELPNYTDTAANGEFVTSVSQIDGKIEVTRSTIDYNQLDNLPDLPEFLRITGENAIEVVNAAEDNAAEKVVKLNLDNSGNVVLEQSGTGLKASIDLSEYAKTADIPDITIATATDKQYTENPQANTEKVIAALASSEHTITPTVIEVVTKAGWDQVVGVNGVRVLNQEELNQLSALNIESDGSVAISGTINASNVHGLGVEVVDIITGTGDYVSTPAVGEEGEEGYIPAVIVAKLGIEKGAQVNKIESIGLPDAVLAINEKQVNIPAFVTGKYGVIKGAAEGSVNTVIAQADGTGKVEKVSTDSLVQGEFELILNGGNANLTA